MDGSASPLLLPVLGVAVVGAAAVDGAAVFLVVFFALGMPSR